MLRAAIFLMVFFSGMTGLIYQVTWQKYLIIQLGSHAYSTALVLSVFFLFLSLGYFVVGRSAHRILKDQVILYGVLELIIGVFGFWSPQYFYFLQGLFAHVFTNPIGDFAAQFIFASLYLGFPTFLMGATIPVLTQGLSGQFELSDRVHAKIYGMNTLGAFVGTVLAGFFLIEKFGLTQTIFFAAWINVLIGIACLVAVRLSGLEFSGPPLVSVPDQLPSGVRLRLYGLSFASGFYVFSLENLIIRFAGITAGTTAYTYTIVVGAFVFSIGVGSFLVTILRRWIDENFLLKVQSVLFLAGVALYLSVPVWPEWFSRLRFVFGNHNENFLIYYLALFLCFVLILIVPIALMGMSVPLLFHYLKEKNQTLNVVVGRLYAVNCLGCVLGASVGGYLIFLLIDGPTLFKVLLSLIAVTLVLAVGLVKSERRENFRWGGAAVLMLVLTWSLPTWRDSAFIPGLWALFAGPNSEQSFQEGVAAIRKTFDPLVESEFDPNTYVGVAKAKDGKTVLYVDGKPDATSNLDARTRALGALIPLAIAPKTEDAFIIGLGGGLSTAILSQSPFVNSVTVAEISRGVINAVKYFDPFNGDLTKNLSKVRFQEGDAYQLLRAEEKKFDLILSEPSNPYVQGVDKLFTKEFYLAAKQRLKPKGVYAQWFPLFHFDSETAKIAIKSFMSAFPYATLWVTTGDAFTLIGATERFDVDFELLKQRFEASENYFKTAQVKGPVQLLGLQTLPPFTLAALAESETLYHTLENPVIGYRSARNGFARIMTSLEKILDENFFLPLPVTETDAKYFIDRIAYQPSAGELQDMVDYISSSGSQISFLRKRYRYLLSKKKDKGSLNEVDSRILADFDYLTGEVPEYNPASSNQSKWQRINELLIRYKEAVHMHLKPQLSKITNLLPASCSEDACSSIKLSILQKRVSVNNLDLMGGQEKQRESIDQKFQLLVSKLEMPPQREKASVN